MHPSIMGLDSASLSLIELAAKPRRVSRPPGYGDKNLPLTLGSARRALSTGSSPTSSLRLIRTRVSSPGLLLRLESRLNRFHTLIKRPVQCRVNQVPRHPQQLTSHLQPLRAASRT